MRNKKNKFNFFLLLKIDVLQKFLKDDEKKKKNI